MRSESDANPSPTKKIVDSFKYSGSKSIDYHSLKASLLAALFKLSQSEPSSPERRLFYFFKELLSSDDFVLSKNSDVVKLNLLCLALVLEEQDLISLDIYREINGKILSLKDSGLQKIAVQYDVIKSLSEKARSQTELDQVKERLDILIKSCLFVLAEAAEKGVEKSVVVANYFYQLIQEVSQSLNDALSSGIKSALFPPKKNTKWDEISEEEADQVRRVAPASSP